MERPSVDGLTRAFTHMSIRCDPRAPKDVPPHIRDALPRDPKIAQLREEKSAILADIKCEYRFLYRAKGTPKWKDHLELGQKIGRMTKKWKEGIKKAYRRQYFYHIHNEELQRQLNNIERLPNTWRLSSSTSSLNGLECRRSSPPSRSASSQTTSCGAGSARSI
jgi:hypothetical protein